MRFSTLLVGAAALFVVAGPVPAGAQTRQQIDRCTNGGDTANAIYSPDLAISGCTAAIQSGRWSGKGLAWAYQARSAAYITKGDYDAALADVNRAIQLDPKLAAAYVARGNAYKIKGDYDRAIADYNEAIRRDPKSAYAAYPYCGRGLAKRAQGDAAGGNADIATGRQFNPNIGDWCN